jgi:predicted transposase YbfD/YdcC
MRGFVEKIKQTFEDMKDPRKQCAALDHSFNGVLTLIATAMVFGAGGPTSIEEYGENLRGHVLRATGLRTVPSHDTIGRVMAMVDPVDLDRAVQTGRELLEAREGRLVKRRRKRRRHVALDGKYFRGSASPVTGRLAAAVVNAWDVDSGHTLATVPFPGPGQEPVAGRTLLTRLGRTLEGSLVSMDAGHCCRETLALVHSFGADWLVPVKGNCPVLHTEIAAQFPAAPPPDAVQTFEKGHGRRETRIGEIVTDKEELARIADRHGCTGLAMIGRVTYRTEQRGKEPTCEICYFSCARRMTVRQFLGAVREHWSVEATLHNRLDVTLGEDRCRVGIGCGPVNFAILRRYALSILDTLRKPGESLRAAITRLIWSFAGQSALEGAM